jgi:hypothetical protein
LQGCQIGWWRRLYFSGFKRGSCGQGDYFPAGEANSNEDSFKDSFNARFGNSFKGISIYLIIYF